MQTKWILVSFINTINLNDETKVYLIIHGIYDSVLLVSNEIINENQFIVLVKINLDINKQFNLIENLFYPKLNIWKPNPFYIKS